MEKKMKQNFPLSIENEGRILPQARDLEEAVIAAVLLEKHSLNIAKEIITDEMFYDRPNGIIYKAICRLDVENKPVDLLTVIEQLKKEGNLQHIGGVLYLARLTSKVVSSAHLEHHCKIVKQMYLCRKFIEISQYDTGVAFSATEDIDDVLYSHSKKLEALQELAIGKGDIKALCEILNEAVIQMYQRKEKAQKGIQPGITTGLADLNRITGGWQKSDLIILAARPSMGKTALALHFAKRAAKDGTPVALFSLEMSDVSLANRLLLSETDVNPDNFKLGKLSQQDTITIEKAVGKLYNYPLYVDSNASVTMNYIHSRCRLLKKRGKCDLVIIDYLQLAGEKGDKNRNRENEVSQMSREAKSIAKDLDVPVILLSQLNRDVDKRTKKIPVLADLRESGAIEQDADMVIFIHRPEYYDLRTEKGYGELIISKYRNGYTGRIPFKYNESLTKIYDFDAKKQSPNNFPF
ncbi:MAG: replicative DNA helicase [Dysgonamonadaceae bacterium]|nr:replicative DNA helicase [Dysgonamonadaceae bacterium]